MQRITLVRYRAKPGRAAENERLSQAVFDQLKRDAPPHVAYGLFRDPDGLGFAHLFINTAGDDSEAVTGLPVFKAFARDIAERCEAEPEVIRLGMEMVAGYGLPA